MAQTQLLTQVLNSYALLPIDSRPHILPQTKHGLNITDYIPPNPAMIVIPTGTPLYPVHMPETKCYFQLHSPHPQCLINEVLPILLKISSICPSFLFPTNTTKLEEDSFIRHITQLSVMNLLNYTSIKYRRLFTWLSILVTVQEGMGRTRWEKEDAQEKVKLKRKK